MESIYRVNSQLQDTTPCRCSHHSQCRLELLYQSVGDGTTPLGHTLTNNPGHTKYTALQSKNILVTLAHVLVHEPQERAHETTIRATFIKPIQIRHSLY